MRKKMIMISAAALLAGCGASTGDSAGNEVAANSAQAEKPKAPHCFFKDADMKGWAASRGKDGNIVVKGKAYRSDPRYQALLGPATVTGTKAEISPTIQQNATGYAAPDNWWDVSATIPNSAAVDTVDVKCGDKTVAELTVPVKG